MVEADRKRLRSKWLKYSAPMCKRQGWRGRKHEEAAAMMLALAMIEKMGISPAEAAVEAASYFPRVSQAKLQLLFSKRVRRKAGEIAAELGVSEHVGFPVD